MSNGPDRPAPAEPAPDDSDLASVLRGWLARVSHELQLRPEELNVDVNIILDLARDAAHQVARPAAPLTTFALGYAWGRHSAGGLIASGDDKTSPVPGGQTPASEAGLEVLVEKLAELCRKHS